MAGLTPGKTISLGLDCAASEYYHDGVYMLKGEGKQLSPSENVDVFGGFGCKLSHYFYRRWHGRK